jgi:DNA-binding CsgD family transcriptional regulator
MHILIRKMSEVNGMTIAEIARELKISEKQVKEALKRG